MLRTFVDHDKLVAPQREALAGLRRFTDMALAAPVMESLVPGWYQGDHRALHNELADAWRHYGWRFDVERLHPGLSDRAWATQ